MKKLLLFSLCLFAIQQMSFGQYAFTQDTIKVSYNATLDEYSGYTDIINQSSGDLSVTWTFNSLLMIPSAWDFGFCDNEGCIIISAANKTNTFPLSKDSTVELSVHITPHGTSSNVLIPVNFNDGTNRRTLYISSTIDVTSIEDVNSAQNQLTIYPNPSSSDAKVKFTLDKISTVEIQIIDLQGVLVSSALINDTKLGSNIVELNTANVAAGSYIVRVIANNNTYQQPFIKL
jgi:hypothetical protein